MSRTEALEAELEVVRLEEALIAAKAKGKGTTEIAEELRAAREAYRTEHRPPAGAQPATLTAKVGI